MGLLRKIGIALSGAASYFGIGSPPEGDEARREKVGRLYASYAQEFPAVPSLTVEELRASDRPWVLVDARSETEREVSMLPGAVPAEVVETDPAAFRDQPLVAYCTIGYRSGQWAARMRERGLDVHNLEGSILSWTHAGGELVTPGGDPTQRVHVYAPLWDLVRTDYTGVW